ncbi:hypothetical protein Lal_00020107 [Lupinus albus]|uniref:non-reducing end alpha-L-arabinofuranosidase n=1 Tax=Lupinus albus TaxID=3870 RepID=A0A6A5ML15_LUPAL|nr:putative glycosidase [Lupinus albus]KAF1871315.1 hypothetical protein Lal_00020107 [Lupinus albus]
MAFYSLRVTCNVLLYSLIVYLFPFHCLADDNQTSTLVVNATSNLSARQIPDNFFGVFLEEINHEVSGGLWAELVSNRGFEAGNIDPWTIIGDNSSISVSTDLASCFEKNKVALKLEVLCGDTKPCPNNGVGISNPGFWGMNIEEGKKYQIIFYVKALAKTDLQISFIGADDKKLASFNATVGNTANWTRISNILEANATYHNASLQITTTTKGVYWLDQVSVMPKDTHKGNGFRKDLFQMVAKLKPKFLRFPGGCFVQGNVLSNAFKWKETVGPWEERPGHLNDVWNYWTDDGFGYFEGLQLAEDLHALPVWVFNSGISLKERVNSSELSTYVEDALDSIEFARGCTKSKWGSVRASMGHPKPFDLRYVAVGNEDCGNSNYRGNYLIFHDKIKYRYPDIKIISNCDGSGKPLDHPADLYDYHIYTNSADMFSKSTKFDKTSRSGPKAFVSEYAVWKEDAGLGSLLAAVSEAAFLIGLEKNRHFFLYTLLIFYELCFFSFITKNQYFHSIHFLCSDIVEMVAYAPLFLNINDKRWIPDAIVFDSYQNYGTPSYWVQRYFTDSSGAILLPTTLNTNSPNSLIASAIYLKGYKHNQNYIIIKVVNFGTTPQNLKISVNGLNSTVKHGSSKIVLTSSNSMDENSFLEPNKVAPRRSLLEDAANEMNVILPPYSVTSFDLLT